MWKTIQIIEINFVLFLIEALNLNKNNYFLCHSKLNLSLMVDE